jgi:hypothetical protein
MTDQTPIQTPMQTPIIRIKCVNCNKTYSRQSAYDKHKIFCNESDPNTIKLDNIDTLTLHEIVIELVKSNNKLRKDVEELKRWVHTKKRKIIILDWLNENYVNNKKPLQNYKDFMSKCVITRESLEIIFKTNIIDGIQEILNTYIQNIDQDQDQDQVLPLISFDQKDNAIYVFNEKNKWQLLSTTDFANIFSQLLKSIMEEYYKWKTENEANLYDEEFSDIYLQNTKKILGGDMSIDKQREKVHRNLYKYLKKNLQNTTEYEFK